VKQIVHLSADGPDFNLRIEQAGRRIICSRLPPPDFVSSYGPGVAETLDDLIDAVFEFLERQRPVI